MFAKTKLKIIKHKIEYGNETNQDPEDILIGIAELVGAEYIPFRSPLPPEGYEIARGDTLKDMVMENDQRVIK